MKCPICNAEGFDGECKECSYTTSGYFYFKLPTGEVLIGDKFKLETYQRCKDGDKIQVLCDVPTCEQYDSIYLSEVNNFKENIELKDLLKECHDILYKAGFLFKKVADIDKVCNIRQRIQEILGEEYGFKKVTYHIRKRAKDLGDNND